MKLPTRIKYHKLTENILVTDWFTVKANYVIRGKIRKSENVYVIEEFDTTQVMVGKGRNLRVCKDNLRNNLIDCGVKFEGESR